MREKNNMSKIFITGDDISEMEVDAIVNATNESLWSNTELSNRIAHKAGHMELSDACDKLVGCQTGGAVITPGFNLKAKHIIHAVGPVWKGGGKKEAMYLDRVYRNALALAVKNDCTTVAFSLISSEAFEYPVEECWRVALNAVTDFLRKHEEHYLEVTFCVERENVRQMGQAMLKDLQLKNDAGQDAPISFLFTVTMKLDTPILVGQDSVHGRRQLVPILSGSLEGVNMQGKPLTGEVLPGGVDIQRVRPDGTCELSSRYGVRLSDGRSFYVENNGICTIPKDYVQSVLDGKFIASDLTYGATHPTIETYDDSLRWLERHLLFCKVMREVDEVKISYYIIGK